MLVDIATYLTYNAPMRIEQIALLQQRRRQMQLQDMRDRFAQKEAILATEMAVRHERQRAIERERIARQKQRDAELRIAMMTRVGVHALTLDQVMTLRPCRRIREVHKLLRPIWDNDMPVSAEQAIALGCADSDIRWVVAKLESKGLL